MEPTTGAGMHERSCHRIACSGVVAAEHGSVASAGFEVLQELLGRGYSVDFFSKRSYVYPETLFDFSGLTYVNCGQPRMDAVIERLGDGKAGWAGVQLGNRAFMRRVMRSIRRNHLRQPYDLELFLGQWAYGRAEGLPVVSWVQGSPGTDARSIRRHRHDIQRLCGLSEYLTLRVYAAYRNSRVGRPAMHYTDICVCGSTTTAQMLVERFRLKSSKVKILPYPINLCTFVPRSAAPSPGKRAELIWVGRVVPRKRLDLFLDAGALLVAQGWNVTLTVIGGFPFASGYRHLIEQFPYPERLTYLSYAPRDAVRERLQEAAVLVQPSEEENFGSSVAEALACGTPVVVGPSNGTADYIELGGVRCAQYTAASVAAAITCVLRDAEARPADVRARAREAALTHFAVKRIVDQLEEIMLDACRGSP